MAILDWHHQPCSPYETASPLPIPLLGRGEWPKFAASCQTTDWLIIEQMKWIMMTEYSRISDSGSRPLLVQLIRFFNLSELSGSCNEYIYNSLCPILVGMTWSRIWSKWQLVYCGFINLIWWSNKWMISFWLRIESERMIAVSSGFHLLISMIKLVNDFFSFD